MEQTPEPRTYVIKRSQHLGYGFVAGYESPTMVKIVEPNGPSYNRLLPGDIIMSVNGIDVENAPREQIINMIMLCGDQIEIKVRQQTYEELIRAKNLADPKFYTLNKSSLHQGNQQRMQPLNSLPLNRLVTPISQQQLQRPQPQPISPDSPFKFVNGDTPPVQIKPTSKAVLKSKLNGSEIDNNNNNDISCTRTLGRVSNQLTNYGRHSPLPQRCKSSMSGTQNGNQSKKSGDANNDQPLLKRSNTMRPIKPPAKVMEIFEVVIKIFFEDGHTSMLSYNQNTTVGTILETLHPRLTDPCSPHSEQIKRYFGLALFLVNPEGSPKEQLNKRLHILDENDSIVKIRQLAYAPRLRLLCRMVYPPSDVSALYAQDKVAFKYLYQQSCNDLKLERFSPELGQDTALKLSALHLLEHVHSNHSKGHGNSKDPKVYIKLVRKDPGIEYFLPASLASSIVDKKGKKVIGKYKKMKERLTEQLKKNFEEFDLEPPKVKSTTNLNRYSSTSFHELSLPEMQSSPSEYIKLLFLNYLSQLPCYGNSKKPVRASTSPAERNSVGDCSSSLESVPRTSDSSPLIRQDCHQSSQSNGSGINGRTENPATNNISRLAQMNSMRSMSSVQSSSISQPIDQPDMVQTPSMESISSITFNLQNSPSPQQAPMYMPQHHESHSSITGTTINIEPSPMPRQNLVASRTQEYHSIERIYSQRYAFNNKPIEELLRKVILLPPPPPPSSMMFDNMLYQMDNKKIQFRPTSQLTQVLTDKDIEKLRVPPPPRIIN